MSLFVHNRSPPVIPVVEKVKAVLKTRKRMRLELWKIVVNFGPIVKINNCTKVF